AHAQGMFPALARSGADGRYRARIVDVLFSSDQPAATDADTVVLGVFEGEPAPAAAPSQAAELLASGEAKSAVKSLALAHADGKRWLLIGLGKRDQLT